MVGSFTCADAVSNGERVVVPSANCNWLGKDAIWGERGYGESYHGIGQQNRPQVSCSDRAAYFKKWNFTYGQIEREMTDLDICSEFRSGTLLRDLFDYMASVGAFEKLWSPLNSTDGLENFLRNEFGLNAAEDTSQSTPIGP
eukprot:gnl/MRDRNA2_/MRDRNA2_112618_c0_seq1.p1 gnl/MRDRNA2_/MRDRNA2_112618_c0~~gnl/MRDRNA2_/MRDRNA2_112618_c0_seq1.p1  ORF type:complete len:142 (+),score=9.45 gnl/MRDRNA2_/MRDRNA2_112618_c0_seq1:413-838(+)